MPPAVPTKDSTGDSSVLPAARSRGPILWILALAVPAALLSHLWLEATPMDAQTPRNRNGKAPQASNILREPVRQGRLIRTVSARGEVATHQPGLVYNDCRYWPRKIVDVVPEGTRVQPGDIICDLDSAEIRTKLRDLTLLLIRAKAGWQKALAGETLQQLKNDRRLSTNQHQTRLTQDQWTVFHDAEADQELRQLHGNLNICQEAGTMAQESLERTRELSSLGINSMAEMEIREVEKRNVDRAVLRAAGQLNLTETFHHRKKSAELQFNAELANDELSRTGLQNELASAAQRVESLEMQQSVAGLQLHSDYLERALKACTIRATRAGELICCHNRNEGKYLEVGGTAHYSQELIRIVDRSLMIVAGRVSETQVFELSFGLPAEVRFPTWPETSLTAELERIAPIPGPMSWFAPNDLYNTVQLELLASKESLGGIAFGTTAVCEIVVDDRCDVLQVPIRAIFRNGPEAEVLPDGLKGLQRRTVVTGITDDAHVEILKGLAVGNIVLTGSQHPLRRVAGSLR